MAGRSTKVDYEELHQEYVASDISLRQLAIRAGLSNSTISEYARKHDWDEDRRTFRMQVARRTSDKLADRISDMAVEVERERVAVLRATLRAYAEQLSTGKILVSPRDIVAASAELSRILGSGGGGGDGTIVVSQPVDEPLLRRILEASREHVADPGGMGGVAVPGFEGTRPN